MAYEEHKMLMAPTPGSLLQTRVVVAANVDKTVL